MIGVQQWETEGHSPGLPLPSSHRQVVENMISYDSFQEPSF